MTAAPFRNIEVLVVDDEGSLREILRSHLMTMGYSVTTAESAEVALRKASEKKFNILVSDIKLGKMDGLELGAKQREKDSALALVFVTGKPDPKGMASAQSLGAIQYIAKPVSAVDLGENAAIAARWNMAQLIHKAAEKYFSIRGGRMSILDNKFQRTKAELKNIALYKKDAALVRDLAYAIEPQSTELFRLMDEKMTPYMRTV